MLSLTIKCFVTAFFHSISAAACHAHSHMERVTTFEDPRLQPDPVTGAEPLWYQARTVTISRSPLYGLGFVAGSERPVVVRYALPLPVLYSTLFLLQHSQLRDC